MSFKSLGTAIADTFSFGKSKRRRDVKGRRRASRAKAKASVEAHNAQSIYNPDSGGTVATGAPLSKKKKKKRNTIAVRGNERSTTTVLGGV